MKLLGRPGRSSGRMLAAIDDLEFICIGAILLEDLDPGRDDDPIVGMNLLLDDREAGRWCDALDVPEPGLITPTLPRGATDTTV